MKFSEKFVCECREYSTYEKNVPAPIFRKSFVLDGEAELAEITVCGLGFYELFVNGKKITKGYLAPYISNSDHYTYFDVYDIRAMLVKGENVVGVMLGDGHQVGKTDSWKFRFNATNSAPLLAINVNIKYGENALVFEGTDFVCKKGPIIFNDLRSGVFYDARLEEAGWNAPGFEEIDWHTPILAPRVRGKKKLCEAEPIRVTKELKPISIVKGEMQPYKCSRQITEFLASLKTFEGPAPIDGGYIYDFGVNAAGIFRLKIKGERGQKISIQCGEQLVDGKLTANNINYYPNGFSQRDIYYLKGDGEEVFEPMFTYHGFRYLYITGITEEQATEELLTYLVMNSALEERGTFECSDPVANKIFEMGRVSDLANFYYFPTDCPHREKNGWTGDASMSAEHMIMTIGAENSWREWLHNIRAAQLESGMLPGIVPTYDWGYEWGNGPAWDSVIFNLPYFAYKYRGDIGIIEENATAMMRYLEYISKRRFKDGEKTGLVAIGLGDWVPVGRATSDYEAELAFTDSVMVIDICRKASEMFGVIGLTLNKAFADALGAEMLDSVRKAYIDISTMTVKSKLGEAAKDISNNRCQTSQAMGIFYDIFTEAEKPAATDVLVDIINSDGGSITSGFLGLRVIFHALSDNGHADLAYKMITKKEYPSYGHWVEKGETALLEQFYPYDEYYSSSKNHHFLGDVVNWFMSAVGGLRVQSADFVQVSPNFIKSLEHCTVTHKLPCGDIGIHWERVNGVPELSVETTGNVKYEIVLKNGQTAKIK